MSATIRVDGVNNGTRDKGNFLNASTGLQR